MIVFFDTSALFKRYVQETGSKVVLNYCDRATKIILASITTFEFQTTLCRRLHEQTLDRQSFNAVLRDWMMDAPFYQFVPLDSVLETAAMQVSRHSTLKTLDVIQLASASVANPDYFLVADKKLFTTAQKILQQTKVVLV